MTDKRTWLLRLLQMRNKRIDWYPSKCCKMDVKANHVQSSQLWLLKCMRGFGLKTILWSRLWSAWRGRYWLASVVVPQNDIPLWYSDVDFPLPLHIQSDAEDCWYEMLIIGWSDIHVVVLKNIYLHFVMRRFSIASLFLNYKDGQNWLGLT